MQDTTQWRQDAELLREGLIEAYRLGDIDSIANMSQALKVLLKRSDRPPPPVRKTTEERRLSAIQAWQKRRAALASLAGRSTG